MLSFSTGIPRAGYGAALALLLFPISAGADDRAYLGLNAGYRSGDFNTSTTSRLYDITPELGYAASNYEVGILVPLLSLNSEGGGSSTTDTGIGDIVVHGSRTVWESGNAGTGLNLGAAVKLATGDEDKGLGTGGTDYGGFVSASHEISGNIVSLMAGYTVTGSPEGIRYDDVVSYGISIQRTFTRTHLYTAFQGQTSAFPGFENPLEWDLGFFHILNSGYVVRVDGFVGLSDGSADVGLRAGFIRWF